ncbi:hypothetical protein pEaSNUABM11_00242 [Erwinia phage pEa_SNUABM_11]|nr:hypothetical protein pEaSNUABM11_00242 [Erwinia phage pEa_SNUABM_11]
MRVIIDLVDNDSQEFVKELSDSWECTVAQAIEDELYNRGISLPTGVSFSEEAMMMLAPYYRALTKLVNKVVSIDVGYSNVISIQATDITDRVNELLAECDVDGEFPSPFRMTIDEAEFNSREFFEIGRCRKLTRYLEQLLHSFISDCYRKTAERSEQLIINFNR